MTLGPVRVMGAGVVVMLCVEEVMFIVIVMACVSIYHQVEITVKNLWFSNCYKVASYQQ